MKGITVIYFAVIILSISMNMCSCQNSKQSVKTNNDNIDAGGKKVKVTNWQRYGWKSKQDVDAKILKEILNGLALYERGESCPFGSGKCESVSPGHVLSKLIKDMLHVNKTSNDCDREGNCDTSVKKVNSTILEKSKTPETEPGNKKQLKKGLKSRNSTNLNCFSCHKVTKSQNTICYLENFLFKPIKRQKKTIENTKTPARITGDKKDFALDCVCV